MGIDDQFSSLNKDGRITRTLIELERRLGPDAFRIVDHWDADFRAIGIARPGHEEILAYVAVGDAENSYYLELEASPAATSELPYALAARLHSLTFDELVMHIARHLNDALQ